MADETNTPTTQEVISIIFEDILPWTSQGGDTGLSARLKLKRNFDKIKMWFDTSSQRYLSRLHDDAANGHITFRQGLTVLTGIIIGDYIFGQQGGTITEEGSAELNDLWVRAVAWIDRLESRNFSGSGIFDRGMAAWIDEQGDSHGILDYLTVRKKWYAWLLEIRELSYVGGDYIFSGAGSRILHVEWYDGEDQLVEKTTANLERVSYFRCWMYTNDGTTRTMNYWRCDDQARCHTDDTVSVGENHEATNKDYWRRVTGIGRCAIPTLAEGDQNYGVEMEYADLSMTDCDINSTDIPDTGDKIVQIGNWTDASRQSLMELQVTGEGSPALRIYHKVGADGRHFVMPEASTVLSPHGNVIRGTFISEAGQGTGDTIEERIQQLLQRINDVKSQADQKIDTWFGAGAPQPNELTPAAEATYPASAWNTADLKALHAGDIYYDENHEPADPNGGRAWRWEAQESDGLVTFLWKDITDADTRESLEKISDVASDGKLTGGTEKTRVLMDWRWEVSQLLRYGKRYWEEKDAYDSFTPVEGVNYSAFNTAWTSLSAAWTNYLNAFKALGRLLNNEAEITISYHTVDNVQREPTAVATPVWLSDLTTTTDIPDASAYRSAWNTYFEKLGLLAQAFAARDGEQVKIPFGTTATLTNDGKQIALRVGTTEATLYGNGGTAMNPAGSSLVVKLDSIIQEVTGARGDYASLALRLGEISTVVTNNKKAADTAFTTLNETTIPGLSDRITAVKSTADNAATWVNQNSNRFSAISAKFNNDGTPNFLSGYMQTANFASMFSTAMGDNGVITSGSISTYLTDFVDESGVESIISNAEIKADNIKWEFTKLSSWYSKNGNSSVKVMELDNLGNLWIKGQIASGSVISDGSYSYGTNSLLNQFKAYPITVSGANTYLYMTNGSVQAIIASRYNYNKNVWLPTLGSIRSALGIPSNDDRDFCVKLTIINQAGMSGTTYDTDDLDIMGDSHAYTAQITSTSARPRIMRGTDQVFVQLENKFIAIFFITYINRRFIANWIKG